MNYWFEYMVGKIEMDISFFVLSLCLKQNLGRLLLSTDLRNMFELTIFWLEFSKRWAEFWILVLDFSWKKLRRYYFFGFDPIFEIKSWKTFPDHWFEEQVWNERLVEFWIEKWRWILDFLIHVGNKILEDFSWSLIWGTDSNWLYSDGKFVYVKTA